MKFNRKSHRLVRVTTKEVQQGFGEAEQVVSLKPQVKNVKSLDPDQKDDAPYTSEFEYVQDELRLLELRLKQSLVAETPFYDSDAYPELALMREEIIGLLDGETVRRDDSSFELKEPERRASELELRIASRLRASRRISVCLALPQMVSVLNLNHLETGCLIACLAPEVDRKYARVYAFLQNDPSARAPTVDLILQLFTANEEERIEARRIFESDAPLMRFLMERRGEYGDSRTPLIARPLKLEDWAVNTLLGLKTLDARLASVARLLDVTTLKQSDVPSSQQLPAALHSNPLLHHTSQLRDNMLRFIYHYRSNGNGGTQTLLYCCGPDEAEKLTCIESVCAALGTSMLIADMDKLLQPDTDYVEMLRLLGRHVLLDDAALCFTRFDGFTAEDDHHRLKLRLLIEMLEAHAPFAFILGEGQWGMSMTGSRLNFVQVDFPFPDAADRKAVWEAFAPDYRLSREVNLTDLSGSFRFTPGQIRAAFQGSENLAVWNGTAEAEIGKRELYQASYYQSSRKIQTLATKIKAMYTWDMLVLPGEQLSQLREICNQVKYRSLVYGEWGFAGRLSLGRGLNILFSGPPGSGKTMSAEVIASELNLELYKIDVSQLVSKYIGETEKNLARIFDEAEMSNAILFFDEADALFGKRSEVKDAHDRYANVEISYLLQKMEEYTGIVILATNLNQNLDDAFARRLHFKVEFPFPEKPQRELIWRGMFPSGAPLASDMDYGFMAEKLVLAGGNIKNIALNAAFYAAHEGCPIGMKQIMQAARREILKLGKTFLPSDYAPYHELIEVN
ncbi:ATP-binding protein [Paenibacillus macerans]|uniref:ATP-binding protein n=1 Tax=Paenibacillus macerans TaxID=44252 RepID=UPI0037CB0DB8